MDGAVGKSSYNGEVFQLFSPIESHSAIYFPHMSSTRASLDFAKGHSRSASHGSVGSSGLVSPLYGGGGNNVAGRPSALKKGHKRALSHGHILDSNELLLNRNHVRTPSKTDFILPEGHRDSESSVFEKYRAAVGGAGGVAPTGHSRQASRTDSVYTLRNNSAGVPPLWKRYLCFFQTKKRPKEEARLRTIVPNHTLPPKSSKHLKSAGRVDNKICTTKYTLLSFLPKNLLEQFHRFANLYFIFIVLLNWFPPINAFGKEIAVLPVLFVLGVTAMKDLFEDRRRHRSDKRINNSVCRVYRDREIGYMDILWKDVRPGDLVRIANNNVIPADILVLHCSDPNGLCFIDTCNLDGESNLKQRQVPHCFVRKHRSFQADLFRSSVEVEPPTTKIYRFNGALVHPSGTRNPVGTENLLLRECVLKNTDFVEGIVVYAGHETKAMLNNNGPRYKRSFLEKQVNNDIMWCVVILLVLCCTGAIGNSVWRSSFTVPIAYIPFLPYDDFSGFYKFFVVGTFIIILQVMIPLSLYVTIELVKLLQVYHIHNNDKLYDAATNKRVECRALNITEELGQVQYIFSDKTGTLTENKMLFRRCTIAGTDYNHPAPAMDAASSMEYHQQQRKPVEGGDSVSAVNPKLAELNNAYNGVRFFNDGDRRFNLPLSSPSSLSRQQYNDAKYVQDFMLVLALCNTVVISVHSPPNDLKTSAASAAIGIDGSGSHLTNPNDSSGDDQYDSEFINEAEEEELDAEVRPRSTPGGVGLKYGQKWLFRNNLFRHFVTVRQPNGNSDQSVTSSNDNSTLATDSDSSPRFHPYSSLQHRLSTLDIFKASAFRTRFFPKRRSPLFRSNSAAAGGGGGAEHFRSGIAGVVGATGEFSGHIEKPLYEAESPDELALVETAYLYSYRLVGRSISSATLVTPENRIMIFDVLKLLPFDSVRKCMSVIVRHPVTNEIIVFCKGADSTILPLVMNSSYQDDSRQIILNRTRQHLNMYASQGLRVLVMARRVLSEKEFDDWIRRYKEAELSVSDREKKIQKCYSEIERNFELLGATGIEDRLQEGVPETIASLRAAGIVVWVLTGDKKETAINVAYSSQLFNPQMEIIRISARSKDSAQNSILCYLKEIESSSSSPLPVCDRPIPGTSGIVVAAADRRASAGARKTKQSVLLSLFSILQRNGNKLLCLASEESTAANNFVGGGRCGIGNVNKQRALVIDGKTLTFILDRRSDLQEPFLRLTRYCTSVLCCRATPLQKAYIVRIVKEKLRMRTLAIGDGANDVSMIQAADVGIGISGQEGMQAVMASDFSMPRFRFLERFLLVHGHWCYDRLANMVLYFFYKNAIFVFLIFWYQLFCGFSGAVMIDEMYLMLYNLFFTSLPPLVIGVYDRDGPEELLMSHPKLYAKGRLGLAYQQPYSFWLSILDALYQSSIIFFFTYSVYDFSEIGIWEFGMTIVTSCMVTMLLQGCLMTRSWSIVLLLSSIISLGSFFLFTLFYNAVCMQCHGLISNVWVLDTTLYTVTYWLVVIISTTCALLPRIVFSAVKKSLMPDDISRLLTRHQSRQLVSQRKENFLVSWSRCASSMLYRSRESKANKQGKSHTLTSVE